MNNYYEKLIQKLESDLAELAIESEESIALCEAAIELILQKMEDIKEIVLKKGFANEEEEIHFFKTVKPNILSKLIYYNSIHRIETKKPYGGTKSLKKYLNNELSKLKVYFDNNHEFYKYYRTNSNYLDYKLFVRGKHDIKLNLDTYYLVADQNFATSHDYKVARIIANDLIQIYLENQILNATLKDKTTTIVTPNWTGSKAALIELIYALHSQAVFDNGNCDIKLITKTFESTFNIDLGDFYHTYLELRNRKINRTKFLDSLRDGLIRKMDEQDEK